LLARGRNRLERLLFQIGGASFHIELCQKPPRQREGFSARAVTTIVAAILIASNYSPKIMVAGFAVFVVASVAWMLSGAMDCKPSLIVQNAVLLIVNFVGIWRWLPRVACGGTSAQKKWRRSATRTLIRRLRQIR
jgi:hypothetical protein